MFILRAIQHCQRTRDEAGITASTDSRAPRHTRVRPPSAGCRRKHSFRIRARIPERLFTQGPYPAHVSVNPSASTYSGPEPDEIRLPAPVQPFVRRPCWRVQLEVKNNKLFDVFCLSTKTVSAVPFELPLQGSFNGRLFQFALPDVSHRRARAENWILCEPWFGRSAALLCRQLASLPAASAVSAALLHEYSRRACLYFFVHSFPYFSNNSCFSGSQPT